MRIKLGSSLHSRHAAAHVFETRAEATDFLRTQPRVDELTP